MNMQVTMTPKVAIILLLYLSIELDKCANDCKHPVLLFSRTILIVRVDPKRWRKSLLLWPGGPVLKEDL